MQAGELVIALFLIARSSKQTCVNFRQLVAAQGYEPSCRRAVHEERPDRVQAVELRMQSIAAILGRKQRVGVGES